MPHRRNLSREAVAVANEAPRAARKHQREASGTQYLEVSDQDPSTSSLKSDSTRSIADEPDEPPRFIVDLSLPPEERYLEVCTSLKSEMLNLTTLFDEIVGGLVPWMPIRLLHVVCWLLLRGIADKEENAELKGVSKAIGIPMYLLVCFNGLLDLFMGCSSGGAAVNDGEGGSKMVHFRTLDWGMPSLRRTLVQLDFVAKKGGPIMATSITYAGFTGVLTGVRKDLSLSLNFRPCRNDAGKFWADLTYRCHLLLVLLGFRQGIPSLLRRYIVPSESNQDSMDRLPSYEKIISELSLGSRTAIPRRRIFASAVCYVCFSSATETTVVEKDHTTCDMRSSDDIVVITNSDNEVNLSANPAAEAAKKNPTFDMALEEIMEESKERKQCAEQNYERMRTAAARVQGLRTTRRANGEMLKTILQVHDVVEMVQRYPTTNETTHFACVMDPKEGKVQWVRRWIEPVSEQWIEEHLSQQ